MPNRYSGQFNVDMSGMRQDPQDLARRQKKQKSMQQLATLAAMGLPIAGMAVGGLVGGPVGAGIGGGIGQAAGQAASGYFANQGEAEMDPVRRKQMEKFALLQAMQGMR